MNLSERMVPVVGGGTSLSMLAGALVLQYGWGMTPCPLCIEQRWAHLAVVVASVILLTMNTHRARRLCAVVPLLMCVAIGAAMHHVLVETGILSASCSTVFSGPLDVNTLLNSLPLLAETSCMDGPKFLGISLPLMNVLASSASLAVMLAILIIPNKGKSSCQPSLQ